MGRRSWALVLAGASLVACSSTDSGAPSADDGSVLDDGGPDVVTTTPDSTSPDAGESTLTQTVGASGGILNARGVSLTIPSGALATDTEISIATGAASVPSGYTALSPVYVFGPSGTVFLTPATIDFTLTTADPSATVFWADGSGYDALATTTTGTQATASITSLSTGFAGIGPATGDSGSDASAGNDSSTVPDSGTTADSSTTADASTTDAVAPADAGSVVDSSALDAGTTDASPGDSAASDAGVMGIAVTIDGVAKTFALNTSVTYVNGASTIQADDSASTTHWQLRLLVNLQTQQACTGAANPLITYTHYTSGTADSTFDSNQTMGHCTITITSTAVAVGEHASGTFTGGVAMAPDAGGATHALTNGSFDVIR